MGRRGGGLFGPDHQIIDPNSKTAQCGTSKLGDLQFLCIMVVTFWQNFNKSIHQGIAAAVFEMRLRKIEHMNFLFHWKSREMQRGV